MLEQELLKVVDRLEELWLEDWALEVVQGQGKPYSADVALQLYKDHIANPLNQALARKQFADLRAQVEAKLIVMDVLHTLQKALERPAKPPKLSD